MLVLVIAFLPRFAEAQNLLTNGTFDTSLAGWRVDYPQDVKWSSQDADGNTHSGSLMIHPLGFELDFAGQTVAVTPGTVYTLSGAMNDQVFSPDSYVYIEGVWLDGAGKNVGDRPLLASTHKSSWTKYQVVTTAPAGAASLEVIARVLASAGTSTDVALYDDLAVTVNPPAVTFNASPSAIAAGQSSTLAWATTNAMTVSIDHGLGGQPLSGSTQVSPSGTTTYTLTATGAGGTTTKQVTVTVTDPPTITFSASPASITTGQSATLAWTTSNATSVSIDNGIGSVGIAGSVVVNPNATTTYTLTASGAGGTRTATATVAVSAPGVPVISFSASPNAMAAGGTSTLTWTTSNATSVSIDNGIGVKPLNGSVQVSPTQTTTYRLTAAGNGGSKTATTTVTITAPPTIVFTATPPAVLPGGTVKLEWQVLDATLVIIDPDLGAQPFVGAATITPKATTTYTLMATGIGGVRSMSVTVVVGGKRRAAKH